MRSRVESNGKVNKAPAPHVMNNGASTILHEAMHSPDTSGVNRITVIASTSSSQLPWFLIEEGKTSQNR